MCDVTDLPKYRGYAPVLESWEWGAIVPPPLPNHAMVTIIIHVSVVEKTYITLTTSVLIHQNYISILYMCI